jgi:hypothetical protein
MTEPGENYYVLLGGPEHYDYFEHHELYAGEQWFWTAPKGARVGETAFVYLSAPVSRIVGRFVFVAEPFYNVGMFDHPRMKDKWVAEFGEVEFFARCLELTIGGLRAVFPDWGWLRYPRSLTRIPAEIVGPFLELIEGSHISGERGADYY